EAAALLGVSASTVKRWVDEGELAAARTAGGHRRIRRATLERLRERLQAPAAVDAVGRFVDLLLETGPQQRIEARLLALRAEGGSAVVLARAIAASLAELGQRWQDGRISVVQEHLASERLARALARLVEWTPLAAGAPRALLAMASGDVGLRHVARPAAARPGGEHDRPRLRARRSAFRRRRCWRVARSAATRASDSRLRGGRRAVAPVAMGMMASLSTVPLGACDVIFLRRVSGARRSRRRCRSRRRDRRRGRRSCSRG